MRQKKKLATRGGHEMVQRERAHVCFCVRFPVSAAATATALIEETIKDSSLRTPWKWSIAASTRRPLRPREGDPWLGFASQSATGDDIKLDGRQQEWSEKKRGDVETKRRARTRQGVCIVGFWQCSACVSMRLLLVLLLLVL